MIVASVLVAIGAVIFARHAKNQKEVNEFGGAELIGSGIPVLLELGSHSCIPCKAMMPILSELRIEYAGSLGVSFIDVWKDPSAGEKYNINSIPTQVFFDSSGKELFRHVGFFGKEDILTKWKDLGVDLKKAK